MRLKCHRLEDRTAPAVFPPDANVIDVTDFGVTPDDGQDDTAALQAVLTENTDIARVIYLPDGIYNVSDTLDWGSGNPNVNNGPEGKRTWLVGQSEAGTVIKLDDDSPLFAAGERRAVLDLYAGNSANAFGNYISEITVDVGSGNPGAVGVEFQTSNYGSVRDVTIKSTDPELAGDTGLNLAFNFPGPMLIKDVTIEGFDTGVRSAPQEYSVTFENLTIRDQRVFGVNVYRTPLQFYNLTSVNAVPAIRNVSSFSWGHVVVVNSTLTGGSPENPAVINDRVPQSQGGQNGAGVIVLRDVRTDGYRPAAEGGPIEERENDNAPPTDAFITQYTTDAPLSLNGSPGEMLRLPVEDVGLPVDPLEDWVSVTDFGATPDDVLDDTAAIQAALDAGFSTVYFPNGGYVITDTLTVGGAVTRIAGMYSRIQVESGLWEETAAAFKIVPSGERNFVAIDHIDVNGLGPDNRVVEHASLDTLLLYDMAGGSYRNTVRGGKVFIEDIVGGPWEFTGQQVWARQLNPENPGTKVVNDGGDFWVLGIKTEKDGTIVETRNGGRSEVLGGLIYPSGGVTDGTPMFLTEDASLTATVAESAYSSGADYDTLVREARGGDTAELLDDDARGGRLSGAILTLYNGYVVDGTAPTAPGGLAATADSAEAVTLNWQPAADGESAVRGYRVFRDGVLVGATDAATRAFTDAGLADATDYAYAVTAVNAAGREGPAAEVTGTPDIDNAPPAVTEVRADRAPATVNVAFSEPVAAAAVGNFAVSPAAEVTGVALAADGRSAVVTVADGLDPDVQYTLTVTGLADLATTPNVMDDAAVAFTAAAFGGGTGLTGTYYDDLDFTGDTFTRLDPQVDFNFGTGGPGNGFGGDTFSIRWEGSLQAVFGETYTVSTRTDDGVRLFIDGELVIDGFVTQAPTVYEATLDLEAGRRYDLVMEYFENSGGALAELRWESPSTPLGVIPTSQLYPERVPTPDVRTVRTAGGDGADTQLARNGDQDLGANDKFRATHVPNTSQADSAGYVRLDLRGLDLEANFIAGATFLLTLGGGDGTGGGVRVVQIFGVNDGSGGWTETGPGHVTWATAAGNNNTPDHADPDGAVWLGGLVIDNTGFRLNNRTDALQLSTEALADFLNADADGLVTFLIKRTDPSNEQTLFWAKEGDPTRAPGLRLVLEPRVSAPPESPDLLPAFDTGSADDDDLTAADPLRFAVAGTAQGATVTVYADGVAAGSAVATGAVTEVLVAGLADGEYEFTATQTAGGSAESPAADGLTVAIDTAGPEASLDGPATALRGKELTITAAATDASAAAGLEYVIDWGDGTGGETVPATPGNAAGVDLTHAYPAAGTYTVTATATDAAGNVSGPAAFEVTVTPAVARDGLLEVAGTGGDDRLLVYVRRTEPGLVYVRYEAGTLAFADVERVRMYGYGGNDTLVLGRRFELPSELLGGDGDDRLAGRDGDDLLQGGPGTDTLTGLAGDDTLIGGGGDDAINGGDGGDVIDGGAGTGDRLDGDTGDDTITDADGVRLANGGGGDDAISLVFAPGWAYQGRPRLTRGVRGGGGDDAIAVTLNGVERFAVYGDQPNGGAGDDRIELAGSWERADVFGGEGFDEFRDLGDGDGEVFLFDIEDPA